MCKRFRITFGKSESFGINGVENAEGRGEKKRIINDLLAQGFTVTVNRDKLKAKIKVFKPSFPQTA